MRDELAVVVLAAGTSRRFDGCKQVAPLEGRSVLVRALRLADTVLPGQVHLVLGARAGMIRAHLDAHRDALPARPAQIIVNADWRQGLGTSLARGVAALDRRYRGVLVLLADQVALSATDLTALIHAWRNGAPLACAEHEGGIGVPAIFDARFFPALEALDGDRGAKAILRQQQAQLIRVAMPAAAIDIDTRAEYRAWLARNTSAAAS